MGVHWHLSKERSKVYVKVESITRWLDKGNAHIDVNEDDMARILKIMEEAGEAAEAYIGYIGQNPRKGKTHELHEVLNELADVAITSLCAIQHFTQDIRATEEIMDGKLRAIIARSYIEVEG